MITGEYEILTGSPEQVREDLNRMGALGWEITSSNAVFQPDSGLLLVVFLRRGTTPQAPEPAEAHLNEFPTFRPHT